MDRGTEPRKLDAAEVVYSSGMIGTHGDGSFLSRRQNAFSESSSRFMPILRLCGLKQDCFAIVGPLERSSEIEATKWLNTGRRVEVFSDRMESNGETPERFSRTDFGRFSRTDFGRLNTLVRSGQITRILVTTPVNEGARIASVMKQLEGVAVDVDLVLEGIRTYSRVDLGAKNVSIARILRRPLTSSQAVMKSILDRVGALLLLVLLAPLLVSIALLVKLTSDGPALFRQKRFGLNNEEFDVLKFRTLHHRHSNPNSQQQVKKQDPQVTSVGKYLRALSLDGLPQLLNVLKGDMSLVGPRPLPVGLNVEGRPCTEFPHYRARHRVRPGIAGLAQVNGWRGGMQVAEDLKKGLSFDLAYVDNYSLLLDAKIMLATCFALLKPNSVY